MPRRRWNPDGGSAPNQSEVSEPSDDIQHTPTYFGILPDIFLTQS